MNWFKMLFSEEEGVSCMRIMSMLSLFFAFAIAVVSLYLKEDLTKVAILCGVFVGPAFAGKAYQKSLETK